MNNREHSKRDSLSIVVPVFREEKNIPEFVRRVAPLVSQVVKSYEIIFCMDPSPDATEKVILDERAKNPSIKLLKFSRRIGQPMAILGGLSYSRGDAVVVMDVDMQDPPEVLPTMVAKWREGFDVVLAQRMNRKGENFIKRFVSHVGYRVINAISDPPIPQDTGDFRLMSRRVVDEINRLKESHGFLRGLVALVGFSQTTVPFERPARFAGQTNYNQFFGSFKIGINGLVCFSSYALTLSSKLGFLVAGLSVLAGFIYALMKIMGFPFPIGNPTIVILILFMGGIQLISVGIVGEYIARIYEEVKQRPKFIVDRAAGFDN